MVTAKSTSETLNESDYRALHLAMERLARIAVGDSTDVILDALYQCVPVAAGLVGHVKATSSPSMTNHAMRVPTSLLESWMSTRPEQLEEALRPVLFSSPGDFWRDADALPVKLRHGLEAIRGLDRVGLGEGAGYKVHQRMLPNGDTEHIMMALMTERGTSFPSYTPARLKALAPALERAILRLQLPLVASRSILGQIMEEEMIGYVCLVGNDTIVELNQRAHDLMSQYQRAAGVTMNRDFLHDFVVRARTAMMNGQAWKLGHPDGNAFLEIRLHLLAKETHQLPADIQLVKMQEFTLPSPTPPEDPSKPAAFECLSDRERQIAMILLRTGLANMEIAWELKISPNTVRTHVENIHRKLKVRTRAELVELVNRGKH